LVEDRVAAEAAPEKAKAKAKVTIDFIKNSFKCFLKIKAAVT
jgi:hypothetical protein